MVSVKTTIIIISGQKNQRRKGKFILLVEKVISAIEYLAHKNDSGTSTAASKSSSLTPPPPSSSVGSAKRRSAAKQDADPSETITSESDERESLLLSTARIEIHN